jgi:ParB family chromosome partitioning protein
MTTDSKRSSLGRGLSALLDDSPIEGGDGVGNAVESLPIEFIRPNPRQPRQTMSDAALDELTQSISEQGVLQPIIVRPHPNETGAFEIVAGERRWRAAQRVPLHEIPVLVRDLDDREVLELAVIENLQRQDLTAIEEAVAYQRLADEFGYTQDAIATRVSKSRSHVANLMRLLALPEPVQKLVQQGELSAGHARALINTAEPEVLARDVVKRGLTVRQTEKLAQTSAESSPGKLRPAEQDANTAALERDLSNLLGLKAEIRFRGTGGTLVLHYGSVDQLDDILNRLSRGSHGAPSAEGPASFAGTVTPDDDRTVDDIIEEALFSEEHEVSWEEPEEQRPSDHSDEDAAPDISAIIDDLIKR